MNPVSKETSKKKNFFTKILKEVEKLKQTVNYLKDLAKTMRIERTNDKKEIIQLRKDTEVIKKLLKTKKEFPSHKKEKNPFLQTHNIDPKQKGIIKDLKEEIVSHNSLEGQNISCIFEILDKRIALGGGEGSIGIFSIDFNEKKWNSVLYKNNIHEGPINSICQISNDNIISCSSDNLIKIWTLGKNELTHLKTLDTHSDCVSQVVTISKKFFASCSYDLSMIIWNNTNFTQYSKIQERGSIHAMLQLKNKEMVVLSCSCPSISFWNLKTKKKILYYEGFYVDQASHMIELPDGNVALSSFTKGNPIIIINSQKYSIEKNIIIDDYLTWNSSLCCVNENSFVYVYEDNFVQISFKDYSIMSKVKQAKNLWGYHGIITINKNKYIIVENIFNGISIFEQLYNDFN